MNSGQWSVVSDQLSVVSKLSREIKFSGSRIGDIHASEVTNEKG